MRKRPMPSRSLQSGAVLLMGIIMLLMVTLIALGVIRLSTRHTQVVNNEQVRSEATSAASYALDLVLNSPADTWDVYRGAGKTQAVNVGISASTDGAADSVAVQVSGLHCVRSRLIKNGELVKSSGGVKYIAASDAACFGGGGTPLTIVDPTAIGSPNDDSLCASVLYQVEGRTADDKLLGADASVVQGVSVRRGIDELTTCD